MSAHRQTPEELRKELDATRRELGATGEALAAKTAVKGGCTLASSTSRMA
jgi:Protein of unknown function (DUF3618)